MKKLPYLFLALLFIGCGGLAKIFNSGTVNSKNYLEQVSFNYDHNIALVPVEINGNQYTFLLDTGAPTCISKEIYDDLNLEPKKKLQITDSQGQTRQQELVIVPKMKMGNLIYDDIGAVVINIRDIFEFDCLGIDGIIGANQMSKSYWKFDYKNEKVTITDQLDRLDVASHKDSLRFFYDGQKTPYLVGNINGIQTSFTYDTGFNGNIEVDRTEGEFKEALGYTTYGSSSIGVYDTRDSVKTRTVKIDSLYLKELFLGAQTVNLSYDNLLGNDFMNKHDVIIDWKHENIYLKKLDDYEPTESKSFGFGYRLINNKAIVTSLIEEIEIDLKIGDQILKINDLDLSNLDSSSSCDVYLNYEYGNPDGLNITFLQDGQEFQTTLTKVVLID